MLLCVIIRQFKLTGDLDCTVYIVTHEKELELFLCTATHFPVCLLYYRSFIFCFFPVKDLKTVVKLRELVGISDGSICSGERPV